jgi:hypothetical protein
MLSPGEEMPEHGTLVGPGLNAQHHQHMFCARIDPAVDDEDGGRDLVVSEASARSLRMRDGSPCCIIRLRGSGEFPASPQLLWAARGALAH